MRMKIGYPGLIFARQWVLGIKNGWDGICIIRIAYFASRVMNSGGEFVLREGGPLRLMK